MPTDPASSSIPRYDETWRAEMHRAVDLIFDHVASLAEGPVVDWKTAEELSAMPELGVDPAGASRGNLPRLLKALASHSIQLHHPRYAGHQVCPPFPPALIGDLVVSALNQSTAVWEMSPAATVIEKSVVRWLADLAGYPESAGGTTVSGGSAANLTALLAARRRWTADGENVGKTPVVFCSSTAHYSVSRAVSILGSGIRLVEVPVDASFRIEISELALMLEALEGTDESPMAIVGTAGSTATGAFDPLHALADLRDRHRTWLHVDAAHGASVLLAPELRGLVRGLERSDSISWDPHKMMWMPLSMSVLLVREVSWLAAAFLADAPYLFHRDRAGLDLGAMTIQCSRRADAVKLWLTLGSVGVEPIREALVRVAETAARFHDAVAASPDFEAAHRPDFNIFCFRWRADGIGEERLDAVNERIRQRLLESGEGWITTTRLGGRRWLRVTIINPQTGAGELAHILDALRRFAAEER